jgi:NADPH-dependent glutamate synthase beta subunit-like oxidoreductase/NAD-dependent dihydropyrimidine dehydrogenase PreA subunit
MIRTVDQNKCIGCGTCQRICPVDLFRLDMHQSVSSPCTRACPVRNNIREIHYLLEMGNVNGAADLMLESNPLASVTGRVCPAFCETDCTRNQVDAAVNISGLEQYLGDYVLDRDVERVPIQHVPPIAVVGSGPAGLSCAYSLAADGYRVTVFEARDEPGGMLRYGIPEYRLPSRVIASITERLQKMGVVVRCGQTLNGTFTLDALREQGYGAVFLGLGAGKPIQLQIKGVGAEDVLYGVEFLETVRTGRIKAIKPRVVVVGGGDVAMDAAQTALRIGAQSVTVVALEDEKSLPAYRHNINTARADGVTFICSRGINRVVCEGTRVVGLDLMKCLSVFDKSGAFSPQYDPTDSSRVAADVVIFAIGQETNLSFLPKELLTSDGRLKVDLYSYQTPDGNVFASGDCVTGTASVAEAVGGGKRAAQAIKYYLGGLELGNLPAKEIPVTEKLPEDARLKQAMRYEKRAVDAAGRARFSELYRGFDLVEAMAEVDRCLSCGAKSFAAHPDDCMTCFNCEIHCPAKAIFVHPFKEILHRALSSSPPSSTDGCVYNALGARCGHSPL